MRYKHIVFDMDGTLVDTERNDTMSLQSTLRDLLGQDRPLEELRVVFGMVGRNGLAKLGYSPEEVDKIYPVWYARSAETLGDGPLYPGIEALLLKLSEIGCHMGVVTSRQRAMYALGAEPNRFECFFPVTVCMEDTAEHKPHPAPLLSYIERAHAEKAETLFIGDSAYDMQCAAAAGVDCALALWGAQDQTLPATYRFRAPEDLLRIL